MSYLKGDLIAYIGRNKNSALKRGETYEFTCYGGIEEDDYDSLSIKDFEAWFPAKDFKLVREAKVKRLLDEIDEL